MHFFIFFRLTVVQVLMVVQVTGTLAKALGRTVLRDRRPRDHSASYPVGLGPYILWVSW